MDHALVQERLPGGRPEIDGASRATAVAGFGRGADRCGSTVAGPVRRAVRIRRRIGRDDSRCRIVHAGP